MDFEKLPSDMIRSIAQRLSVAEIISNCRLHRRFNSAVCNNLTFWRGLARQRLPYGRELSDTLPLPALKRSLHNYEANYVPEEFVEAALEGKQIAPRPNPRRCQPNRQPVMHSLDQLRALPRPFPYQVLPFPNEDRTETRYYTCPNDQYPFPGIVKSNQDDVAYQPCCYRTERDAIKSFRR
jgi:hypothetical protein